MTSNRKKAYLALLTTAVIWGFAPPIIKYTLGFVTPLSFLFFRFLLVTLILIIPLLVRLRKLKPTKKQLLKYAALGFLGTPLTLYLLFWGIANTSAIDASIISIVSPILVVLVGALWLKEKVTKRERIGIALTLIGTITTVIQPLFETGASLGKNIFGNILVLGGTICWAGFTLGAKKEKQLDPFILSTASFLVGFLSFLPFWLISSPVNLPPLPAIPGILYMAVFGSVVAYFTYIYGLAKIEASEATIFTYLQPLFAVPVSAVFLDEKITPVFLVGAFLVALGVFITEKR